MPLTPLGIFHTILGLISLVSVLYLLFKHGHILYRDKIAKLYLACTFLTASTALGIFQHDGFNAAHALAILTLIAVLVGLILEFFQLFGRLTKYLQLCAFSSTLLFHLIPTATEILTRFPMDEPMVSSLQDPLLQKTFLVILVLFLVLLGWQIMSMRKQNRYV